MLGNCTECLEEPKAGCLVNITWNTSQSKALTQTDINLPKAQNYSCAVKKSQECSQESLLEPVPAVWPHPAVPALSTAGIPAHPSVPHPSLAQCSSHSASSFIPRWVPVLAPTQDPVTNFMALSENSSVLSEHHRAMFIYFYFKHGWKYMKNMVLF